MRLSIDRSIVLSNCRAMEAISRSIGTTKDLCQFSLSSKRITRATTTTTIAFVSKSKIAYNQRFSLKPYYYHRLCDSPRVPLLFVNCASHSHDSHHHDHHDHHHHHHHHHHHGHGGEGAKLTGSQRAVLRFAKAIGWADLADLLREHLQLCCCSAALLLAAAACPYLLPKPAAKTLQNAFISVAFPLVGVSAGLDALIDIAAGKINIHVLMALAAFASVFMGNPLEGALLLAMFNLAHIAEEYFTSRSMVDVKELKESYPDFALVLTGNGDALSHFSDLAYTKIPVHDLEVGSCILVRAGEATKTWKDSTLSRIVQLTEEAHQNKPKLQRWLDEFGEHYSKVVVVLSFAVALLGPFLFKWPFISTSVERLTISYGVVVCRGSIYRALGLMVAASPCALAVAPLAYATAISACASKGILLKGGHVFDALASCHTIAFDKTGTLTTGELKCKAIEPIHGHEGAVDKPKVASCCIPDCEKEALAVAAAMEKGTTHPIGRAVVDHSIGKDLPSIAVENFESLPGRGLFATLTCSESDTGSGDLLKASLGSVEYITSLCKSEDESEKIKLAIGTSAYGKDFVHAALCVNKKVTLFHFEDKPRPGVEDVISTLKDKAKLRVMMLTGDHSSSALRVASAVGISEVYCNLKPEDKLNQVKTISRDMGEFANNTFTLPLVIPFTVLGSFARRRHPSRLPKFDPSPKHPSWSWKQDFLHMLDMLKSSLFALLKRPPTSTTIQPAPS
ncbi:hypothetical protein Scep_020176 [Stephania cephalantha]|uniref:Cadmium/zinc-transporting ATPase HMA1, chloroplastic n=1 Tax=Stephania cephalantha TaxID=152367 RepID=A0AAP0NM60_9MAGN